MPSARNGLMVRLCQYAQNVGDKGRGGRTRRGNPPLKFSYSAQRSTTKWIHYPILSFGCNSLSNATKIRKSLYFD